jgi:hypothetical protein
MPPAQLHAWAVECYRVCFSSEIWPKMVLSALFWFIRPASPLHMHLLSTLILCAVITPKRVRRWYAARRNGIKPAPRTFDFLSYDELVVCTLYSVSYVEHRKCYLVATYRSTTLTFTSKVRSSTEEYYVVCCTGLWRMSVVTHAPLVRRPNRPFLVTVLLFSRSCSSHLLCNYNKSYGVLVCT